MSFLFSSGVRDVIPDSGGTHQWNATAGGGTTLADVIGSLDGTISGATWQTGGDGVGQAYLEYDGAGDETDLGTASRSELSHFVRDGKGTIAVWINPDATDANRTVIGTGLQANEAEIFLGISQGSVRFTMVANGSSFSVNIVAGSVSTNDWQLIAGTMDGSTARAYHASHSDSTVTEVGTDTISGTDASDLSSNVKFGTNEAGDRRHDGSIDIGYTDSTQDTESELDQWLSDTKQYYS